MVKQTAGRDSLGDFAPKFAELNDDVLFGEVWSREKELDLKTRSIITVVALVSKGILDSSLKYHIINAKKNGVTKEEFTEILAEIDGYEAFCRENPDYQNNRATHAIANISRVYDERLQKHAFL